MPIALYIIPYTRVTPGAGLLAARTCDLYLEFPTLSGQSEEEVRGNRALVKINERDAVLTQLDALYYRLPVNSLGDSLSGIGAIALARLDAELLDMGYTALEIAAAFPGGLGSATLGSVVRFMASRVFTPRYDSLLDAIVLDQEERDNGGRIDTLNRRVR